ncbi:MAG: signal peptidase I [Proteobacteria bacterium]|nr:signal peptidase I [Pseudomonadota bacterium]
MRKIVFAERAFHKFKKYFKLVLATIIIIVFTKLFLLDFYWIPSVSMEPTLLKGDHVVALKIAYGFLFRILPSRGDIVVFKLPADPSYYVKRVIALPDETVNIKLSDLIINNKKVKKIYDVNVKKYKYIESDNVVLKEFADNKSYSVMQSNIQMIPDFITPYTNTSSGLFLLGDNRSNSIDSRNWGSVDKKRIIGKIVLIWLSIDPETHKIRWDRLGLVH